MEFKMSRLKQKHIFMISKIMKKIDIKLDIKGMTQEQFGFELVKTIVENLYMAEEEVNFFLADIFGIKKEEIEELDIEDFMEMINIVKNYPGIANFFKQAGQLMK